MSLFFKRLSWVAGILGFVMANYLIAPYDTPDGPEIFINAAVGFIVGFVSLRLLGWCFSIFSSGEDDTELKDLEKKVKIKELKKKLKDLERE